MRDSPERPRFGVYRAYSLRVPRRIAGVAQLASAESRVCHLLQDASYGGVESLLADLVRETDGEFDHHVCHLSDHDEGAAKLRDAGATVSNLDVSNDSPRAAFDPRSLRSVAGYLRRHDVDVLHAHYPLYPHVVGRVAAKLAGVDRVVGTYHNQRTDFHPVMLGVEWATRPLADDLVGVSDRTAGTFETLLDGAVPGAPSVETIPDGIDVAGFNDRVDAAARADARDRWGVDEDALVFLCVGRFAVQKNQTALVRALDEVREDLPSAHLLLVGHGPFRSRLEELAESVGQADNVTVAGPVPRDEIHHCYAAADAFALSSTSEGLGIALVEAMAAELPVVATEVAGPSDVVREGETGHLVPPGSPSHLADAMGRLADADERDRLGRNGYQRAERTFDIETVADAYEECYRP